LNALLTALPLFTHDGDWNHAWWPIWPFFWVLFIVGLFWFFGRRRRGWYARDPFDQARAILAERYARDEITAEEYRKRLDELGRDR
jgi:putative membrane protein